jgi:hypothetical protein
MQPLETHPCSQNEPCWTKDAAAEKALPRWRRPEWVIVYVTVIYAFLAGLTLLAIKLQASIMERQIAISINQQRPRLHIEPQPFTAIINGLPDVRIKVTNIGGSKAIFGFCIAGMEATGVEVDVASRKQTNSAMLKRLTSKILESEECIEDKIDAFLGSPVFPPDLDKTKPYKLHIYGVLNFKDIISEDSWFREFHYVLLNAKNVYMVHLGKMSSEVWRSLMEEEDRSRKRRSSWSIRRAKILAAYKKYQKAADYDWDN